MFRTDRFTARLFATAAALPMTMLANPAHAQTTPAASGSAANTAEAIIVLGTRRQDRTLTNSASPVDVIGAKELDAQPSGNMLDTLKNIVPSFFVPQNSVSDASTFVRAPSLRGLPGDEILVMLDGKRYNRSALVQVYNGGDTGLSFGSQGSDISAIPAIGLKDLEILRDGATAQYGSDAIAGVLNYGLKDANHGFSLESRYGQYYDHGDGKSKQIAGNLGLALGEHGFVNLSGEYDDDGQTSRGVTRVSALNLAASNPSVARAIPGYPNEPAQNWGNSPSHGYKFLANTGYDISDSIKLYAMGNYAWSHANESFNYRSPIKSTGVDSTGTTKTLGANGSYAPIYLTPCPAGNATCQAGGFVKDTNTYGFSSLYPGGFTPRFVGVTEELFGTLGLKGKAGQLAYDLSGSASRNTLDLSMYNSLSPSYGPQSATSFKFGKLSQKELDGDLDLSLPIEIGLASPLTLSGGAEYRKETYSQAAGDPQSYGAGPYASQNLYAMTAPGVYTAAGSTAQSPGASGYGGTSPTYAGNWSQENVGVYGDIETDITKSLSVGLAGRYEHYNTFGGATVGKFNAIYKIIPGLSIRGSAGTGFHAPSPGQAHDAILTTNFVGGDQVQTGTYPVTSPISAYYGAQTLKPEKSTNFGLGFVAKPLSAVTLTVDAYSIKVRDRIGISRNFAVTADDIAAQPALSNVGVGGVINYFTNGFDTLTRGIDAVATYRTGLADGTLNLTAAYNYNKSKVTSSLPGVLSADQIIDIGHLAPNHRAVVSASWTKAAWTLDARGNYYGSWENATDYPTAVDANGNVTAAQVFGAKVTADLDVSYTFAQHFTFTVGGTNLFNTKPDKIAASAANPIYPVTGGTAAGQVYPRNGGPFGMNGGFWYVRLKATY